MLSSPAVSWNNALFAILEEHLLRHFKTTISLLELLFPRRLAALSGLLLSHCKGFIAASDIKNVGCIGDIMVVDDAEAAKDSGISASEEIVDTSEDSSIVF